MISQGDFRMQTPDPLADSAVVTFLQDIYRRQWKMPSLSERAGTLRPSPCSKRGATVLPSAVRPCESSIGTALSRTPRPCRPTPLAIRWVPEMTSFGSGGRDSCRAAFAGAVPSTTRRLRRSVAHPVGPYSRRGLRRGHGVGCRPSSSWKKAVALPLKVKEVEIRGVPAGPLRRYAR